MERRVEIDGQIFFDKSGRQKGNILLALIEKKNHFYLECF
jgi:hypothetical protein